MAQWIGARPLGWRIEYPLRWIDLVLQFNYSQRACDYDDRYKTLQLGDGQNLPWVGVPFSLMGSQCKIPNSLWIFRYWWQPGDNWRQWPRYSMHIRHTDLRDNENNILTTCTDIPIVDSQIYHQHQNLTVTTLHIWKSG